MKVLVVCSSYPDLDGNVGSNYIRVRNVYYKRKGIGVYVLNFWRMDSYEIDGIPVMSLADYEANYKNTKFDILICHAANLREHYKFLKKYGGLFPRFVFFFHGHEVLKINKVYSKPYPWQSKKVLGTIVQNLYDDFKLSVWHRYYLSVKDKTQFVFVSNWMLNEFEKWVKISREQINYHIIYNSVSYKYEVENYDCSAHKKYDFISIRAVLSNSKYSVDIINAYAWKNPQYSFLLFGKGDIFEHIKKAPNLTLIEEYLNQDEIISYLNQSRIALMPTRTDAQGVMMCEMATFGIPVITSNIPVCHEVFDDFNNVAFIDNDVNNPVDLSPIVEKLSSTNSTKNPKYFEKKTVQKEVEMLEAFIA